MQSRRRSFADRFGPAGIGAAQPEYRKFGRGGGPRRRGPHNSPPPHLPPPPPPRRRADVLREAGRLAAEYLAAKGLLPANPVPSSAAVGERLWPNGGDDEADRTSAFSRLGRRRLDGDDGGFRARKRVRRRRHRSESYRRPGPEWGREDVGGPPWADRARDYSDAMDAEDLERSWRWSGRERRLVDPMEDGESDRRSPSEESDRGNGSSGARKSLKSAADYDRHLPSKDELTGESDSDQGNHNSIYESGSKAMGSSEGKAHPHPIAEAEMNLSKGPDEMEDAETDKSSIEKAIGGDTVREKGLQREDDDEGLPVQSYSGEKEDQLNNGVNGQVPSSEKIPAQPSSSEAKRNAETERKPDTGEMRENSDAAPGEKGLKNAAEAVATLTPSNGAASGQSPTSRGPTLEVPSLSSTGLVSEVPRSQSAQPVEPAEQGLASGTGRSSYSRSSSFPESSFQQLGKESIQGPTGFDISTKSIGSTTEEDSAGNVVGAGMKQPQEWPLPSIPRTVEKQPVTTFDDDYEEQSRLPSSSFKICDLNVAESPEITSENRLIKHASTSAASLERENNLSVGFGQKCDGSDLYGRQSNDTKAARVVIDLEDDSVEECSAGDASQSK